MKIFNFYAIKCLINICSGIDFIQHNFFILLIFNVNKNLQTMKMDKPIQILSNMEKFCWKKRWIGLQRPLERNAKIPDDPLGWNMIDQGLKMH